MTWRLSVGGCQVVILESYLSPEKCNTIYWKSEKYPNHSYRPINSCRKASDCTTKCEFILIGVANITKLKEIGESLRNYITDETIIFLDASYAVGLEYLVREWYPDNAVVSIICEAVTKIIEYNDKYEFCHLGNKVATAIGSTVPDNSKLVQDTLAGSGNEKLACRIYKLTTYKWCASLHNHSRES